MSDTVSLLTKYGLNLEPTDNILFALFIIFGLYIILGEIFERIGLNELLGHIITGVILGGSLLNLVDPSMIEQFAFIGSILILFLAGLSKRTDSSLLKDRVGIGIGTIVFFATLAVMVFLFSKFFGFRQAIFLGLAYAVVDLFVPVKILVSKKLLRSNFGQAFLNMSISNVFIGLLLLSTSSVFIEGGINELVFKIGGAAAFIFLIFYMISVIGKVARKLHKLKSSTIGESQLALTFIILFLLSFLTETIGLSVIIGAFVAGVVIRNARFSKKKQYVDKIQAVSNGIFIPLFFVWFGLKLDLISIWGYLGISLLFIAASLGTKFTVTYFLSKQAKLPAPGTLASSMLSLDVESMIIILTAIKMGVFTNYETFNIFAPAVPITTIIVTLMIGYFAKKEYRQLIVRN
ncbi:cation:proton antiporter [Candidatus Woesearchaeota archaeon]|nr:cation:proton antiporter [Candidatus Woesearchaeota archaeon]